jgi:hypothetical protein
MGTADILITWRGQYKHTVLPVETHVIARSGTQWSDVAIQGFVSILWIACTLQGASLRTTRALLVF